MISFGLVVAVNNLLALKSFTVFLTNYCIHQNPSLFQRYLVKKAKGWIEKQALREFEDIKQEIKNYSINLGINDCSTGMFTVLYIAELQNRTTVEKMQIKTGLDLFQLLAEAELEFEILKKNKQEVKHGE